MKLRFPKHLIREFAQQYDDELSIRDKIQSDGLEKVIFPAYRNRGYLTKKEFLKVCMWKTPRSKPHCESNEPQFIKEVSSQCLRTKSDQMRIQAWTMLNGVKWPTASVFLCFAFPNRYPIMDVRALWSLGEDVPSKYTYEYWAEYTKVCRTLSKSSGVTMRTLDKALWKYSELHQPKLY